MDPATRQFISTLTYALFQIPCSIFLLAILVPLYKVAADRTAVYILFSKTCFNIANQLSLSIYQPLKIYAPNLLGPIADLYPPFGQCLYQIIYVHILALAINRFVAIFFMFDYSRLFTKKKTFAFTLFVWAVGLCLGILVINAGSGSSLNQNIQITVLTGSSLIYGATLVKFGHGKFFNKSGGGGSEKDRILLSCICFISVLPLLFAQIIRQGLLLNPLGSPIWICFSIAQIANVTAVQFVEECCLIIFCKDFRVHICKQFPCIFPHKSTTQPISTFTVQKVQNAAVNGSGGMQKPRIKSIAV